VGSDEKALIQLWREKPGEIGPEDLSGDLVVQLGAATEDLNRAWYERSTPTYAEVLHATFGRWVIGLQIGRHDDGMQADPRPVGGGSMLIYNVGRNYLLEPFHAELQAQEVRMVNGPMVRRTYGVGDRNARERHRL
jgi:hypothetical protein